MAERQPRRPAWRWIEDSLMWCSQDNQGAAMMTEHRGNCARFVASHAVLADHGIRRRRIISRSQWTDFSTIKLKVLLHRPLFPEPIPIHTLNTLTLSQVVWPWMNRVTWSTLSVVAFMFKLMQPSRCCYCFLSRSVFCNVLFIHFLANVSLFCENSKYCVNASTFFCHVQQQRHVQHYISNVPVLYIQLSHALVLYWDRVV